MSEGFIKTKELMKKFFNGHLYPVLVGAIVLVSHIFGAEFYLNFLNVFLCVISFLICDSTKPFIPVLCTYVYQFSRLTNISDPSKSDFYYTGARLYTIIALFVIAILAAAVFFVKHGKRTLDSLKHLPMLPAAILLSVAFLANGVFSDGWSFFTFGYGAVQIATFFVIFYFFVVGLRDESGEELCGYFAFVTAVMASVLIIETANLYLFGEGLIVDGSVIKEKVDYGWGMWNTAGQQMVMTLPMLFYGAMKNKHPLAYLVIAVLTVASAALTMSRNALILSVLFFGALAILACFFGNLKKQFRIILPVGVVGALGVIVLLWDKISRVLADYLERGLSDNGRFDLWRSGFESFLKAPVFGRGFFGAYPPELQDGGIFPAMAHNTIVELLCAMGIFGLVAYLVYRAATLKPFVIRPTLAKSMLGVAMLTVILGSVLDNFIFYYHQMLYYPVAQAIAYKLYSEQEGFVEPNLLPRLLRK